MDIYISQGSLKLRMPILPSEYTHENTANNETVNINAIGEVSVLGKRNLKTVSFSSIFPAQKYSFYKGTFHSPNYFTTKIEKMMESGEVRLIVTGSKKINMLATIETFAWGENDGSKDINYDIEFREYRKLKVAKEKKKVKKTVNKKSKKVKKTTTSRKSKTVKSTTYVVKKGDTLCRIAKKLTGSSSNYRAIANQNNIKNPNKIYVGQKLVIKV